MNTQDKPLLDVADLQMHYRVRSSSLFQKPDYVRAVDGVSFSIAKGETLGLIGESGCGKSSVGRSLVRLVTPTAGSVRLNDVDLLSLSNRELVDQRRNMQIVFQDPFSSLDPRLTAERIVSEPLINFGIASGQDLTNRVEELFEQVGLQKQHLKRFPHEFSGGQRQRLGIARAIALKPAFVVCDEAVSALDVSVQAQIINLLIDLQKQLDLSYLFISHDLAVVEHISDRIAVMYLGKIVEIADRASILQKPLHPYTQALVSAIPRQHPSQRKEKIILKGDLPSATHPPTGCRFHTRCPMAMKRCSTEEPVAQSVGDDHVVACHLIDQSVGGSG